MQFLKIVFAFYVNKLLYTELCITDMFADMVTKFVCFFCYLLGDDTKVQQLVFDVEATAICSVTSRYGLDMSLWMLAMRRIIYFSISSEKLQILPFS